MKLRLFALLTIALAFVLSSCGRNMYDQPRFEALEASQFSDNGASWQLPQESTLSRERGAMDESFFTGLGDSGLLTELPFPVTMEVLERGQQRYNIYCSPCHNFDGNGQGMIVQKGFPQPTSFHEQRLRDAEVGYFYNAITNGFGRMYSYAGRIPPEDRWAISAYIRALQLSQNASLEDLSGALQEEVMEANQ